MLKPEWIPSAYQDAAKQPAAGAVPAAQPGARLPKQPPVSRYTVKKKVKKFNNER